MNLAQGDKRSHTTLLAYGTTVNGAGLAGPELQLKDGDGVSFGNVAFCFLLTDTLYVRLLRQPAKSPRG